MHRSREREAMRVLRDRARAILGETARTDIPSLIHDREVYRSACALRLVRELMQASVAM